MFNQFHQSLSSYLPLLLLISIIFAHNAVGIEAKEVKKKEPKSNKADKSVTLLFLDCDGVLNDSKSDVSQLYVLENKELENLSFIIKETDNLYIVMTSTWRYTDEARKQFKNQIKEFNNDKNHHRIPNPISYTPILQGNRLEEILTWLKENTTFLDDEIKKSLEKNIDSSKGQEQLPIKKIKNYNGKGRNKSKLKVNNLIAIDDLDILNDEGTKPEWKDFMAGHFIRTNKKYGLTETETRLAIKVLNNDQSSETKDLLEKCQKLELQ